MFIERLEPKASSYLFQPKKDFPSLIKSNSSYIVVK
jgi:hypothetical protein